MKHALVAIALIVLTGPVAAATVDVDIRTFQFAPGEVTAKVGDTVRWTNHDAIEHSATVDGASAGLDTGLFGKDGQGTVTFDKAGRYPYHCARHPSMKGVVVVSP